MSAQDRDFLGLEVSMIVTRFGGGDKRITGVVQSLHRSAPTSRPTLIAVETMRNFQPARQAQAVSNGGPAFPIPGLQADADFNGMTLRDYFAAKVDITPYGIRMALESKLDRLPTMGEVAEYIAQVRYLEADAMLAERAK